MIPSRMLDVLSKPIEGTAMDHSRRVPHFPKKGFPVSIMGLSCNGLFCSHYQPGPLWLTAAALVYVRPSTGTSLQNKISEQIKRWWWVTVSYQCEDQKQFLLAATFTNQLTFDYLMSSSRWCSHISRSQYFLFSNHSLIRNKNVGTRDAYISYIKINIFLVPL